MYPTNNNLFVIILLLINKAASLYTLLIFVRAILSWFSISPHNKAYFWLLKLTNPALDLVRRVLPPMPVDVSPIVVYIVIRYLIQDLLIRQLIQIAQHI